MEEWKKYGEAIARHYQEYAEGIGAKRWGNMNPRVRHGTKAFKAALNELGGAMSECKGHALVLTSGGTLPREGNIAPLSDKPADVADLTCPICGHTLFVYYRHAPYEGGKDERTTEAADDPGADHGAQPQERQEQQKEGSKE